jgi:hypothetical protein
MSDATIRAKIKAILQAVTGMGQVHDYPRYVRSRADLKTLLRKSGSVNAWIFYREKAPADLDHSMTARRRHVYRFRAWYEISDSAASEKTFQALIDAVFTAVLNDTTLLDVCLAVDPLNVDTVEDDDMDGTLYHYAECSLACTERAFIT